MVSPGVRAITAASAAATVLYTPLLKRLPLVKTCTVAAVISAAPLAGALAAGAGAAGLHAVAPACAFLFLTISCRCGAGGALWGSLPQPSVSHPPTHPPTPATTHTQGAAHGPE